MKNRNLFVTVCLLIFFASCNKEDGSIINKDRTTNVETRQIVDTDPSHRLISDCDALDLTISIPECLDEEWVDAIFEAMDEFNSLTNVAVSIRLITNQEVANGEQADIPFVCSDHVCSELLDIFFPGIRIGFATFDPVTIQLTDVDEVVDCCDNFLKNLDKDCLFKGVVMHEIMHTLGFAHDGDTGPDLQVVPGTPQEDPNSIMIGNDGCTPRCEFSEFDILALETLYPQVKIDGPDFICLGSDQEYCIVNNTNNSNITWSGHPSIEDSSDPCVQISNSETGIFNIEAEVELEDCSYILNKTVTICQEPHTPTVPPIDLYNICFNGDSVCYDFGNNSCLSTINVQSSNPKLLVDVQGTNLCLSSIHPNQSTATLTIQFVGHCGNGEIESWTINMNDSEFCDGF